MSSSEEDQKLGKRAQPSDDKKALKDNLVKKTSNKGKDKDGDFTVKETDFDPRDQIILNDGEVSSEHSSYNDDNFNPEDFMNFVKKSMASGNFDMEESDGADEDLEEEDFSEEEGDDEESSEKSK